MTTTLHSPALPLPRAPDSYLNCLLITSAWISNRHIKFTVLTTKLLIILSSISPTHSTLLVLSDLTKCCHHHTDAQAQTLSLMLKSSASLIPHIKSQKSPLALFYICTLNLTPSPQNHGPGHRRLLLRLLPTIFLASLLTHAAVSGFCIVARVICAHISQTMLKPINDFPSHLE